MSSIDTLGDKFLATFNTANNFTVTTSLNPPIYKQKYFRALGTRILPLKISFARACYSLDSSGVLTQSNICIVGTEYLWHICASDTIDTVTLQWFPPTGETNLDPFSLYFEFLPHIPLEYIYHY